MSFLAEGGASTRTKIIADLDTTLTQLDTHKVFLLRETQRDRVWGRCVGVVCTFVRVLTEVYVTMSLVARYIITALVEKVRNLNVTVELLGFHLTGRLTAA